MIRGLYVSGTNLKINQMKIDALSNNLANSETFGFKTSDILAESFNNVLINKYNGSHPSLEKAVDKIDIRKNNDDFFLQTKTGYFRVENQEGVSHNKNVKFYVNDNGYLSTYYLNSDKSKDKSRGNLLLDSTGNKIQVPKDSQIDISEKGDVLVDGNKVANLIYMPGVNVIGTVSSGVRMDRMYTNFAQGNLVRTENNFDIALMGDGFFEIDTPSGILYTRAGMFTKNKEGILQISEGFDVIGQKGKINVTGDNVSINTLGEIIVDGQLKDKLKIVNFSEKSDLLLAGGTYYDVKNNMTGEKIDFEGEVRQGYLEESISDAIKESISVINFYREYETGQKIIKAYDDTIGKVVTEVGKV